MADATKPESTMQRFRKGNRRIDFYPTTDALAAIERLRQSRPGESTRLLIDRLVIAGIKEYFPETSPPLSGKT
jgi:hypothetical protein